ncbi:dsRBD fold-containing protein [Blastococcus sp. URHD0036]|uniref:dsRBD fold-containing protein n=1 Tax=Blastococcus sp. URHD0036 TaxID=1380356 RepID=UPI000495B6C8|nr:dsRBD fold-containing protein [Blastococcus sp. URHD0036]
MSSTTSEFTDIWDVVVTIDEHDGRTRAVARLRTRAESSLAGVGFARLDPADRQVARIGDEIAAARALRDLAGRLLRIASDDVARNTGETAQLVT